MSARISVPFVFAVLLGSVVCAFSIHANAGVVQRQTESLPDIQAPSGGSAFWIARAMRLNGVPMTIKSFASPTNADEVLHQYEHALRTSSDIEMRRSYERDWRVLAVISKSSYVTIRARNTPQGSEGTIAVTPPLANFTPRKHTRFPHPASTRVITLQEYDDAGTEAEHISLVSRRSVGIEARAFESLLVQQGWQLVRSEFTARRGDGHVIEAQKAAQLALINLRRANLGGTTVLIVWKKA